MKKLKNVVVVTAITSSLIVTPVFAQPDINEIEQNKEKAEKELEGANQELVTLMTEFEVLKKDISNQEKNIKKASKDLKKAQETEEKQYEAMKLRIKYMYEKDQESELVEVLESGSLSEMNSKAEYIKKVHSYDRKMLTEYQKTKEKVVKLKGDLETEQADMEMLASIYTQQQTDLNIKIASMEEQVETINDQLEEAKRQAEEEARRLEEETRRMQAEEEARKEAEKAAQREAAASHQESNRPSSNQGQNNKPAANQGQNAKPEVQPEEVPSNVSLGQKIANEGLKYVGNPYVWGGNSLTNGVDCSGFTSLVHAACGVKGVPRQSSAQRNGGKPVNGLANALPGDIICYSGHVAIYIGGGQIVHASNPSPYPKGGIKTGSATYKTILAIRRYW